MWHVWGDYYVDGNVNTKYPQVTEDNWTYGIYNQIDNSKVDNTFTEETKDTMRLDTPIEYATVYTHSAEKAFEKVLAYAGASLHRDALDEVIVSDTRNGETTYTGKNCKRGIINSQDDLRPADASDDWSAWPKLKSETAPADTDGDGIPDEWESQHGLDPNNGSDGKATAQFDVSGLDGMPVSTEAYQYTNLEVYLDHLVYDITSGQFTDGKWMSGHDTTGIIVPFVSSTREDHRIYTLDGRQTNTIKKGIYIRNNKKFVSR
jgi:hypothetical protein